MPTNRPTTPPPFDPWNDPSRLDSAEFPTGVRHRRPKRTSGFPIVLVFLILSAIVVGALAFQKMTGVKVVDSVMEKVKGISAKNVEQQQAIDWVYENEGDPSSVEFIKVLGPDRGIVYVKYRCTGPAGGPIVRERCIMFIDDDMREVDIPYIGPDEP